MRRGLFLLLFLIPVLGFSQSWKRTRKEMVYGAGVTNFLGDLGGANQVGTNFVKDLELSMTRPAVQVGYRYRILEQISLKGGLYYGLLRGDDKLTQEVFRNYRNLHFRSNTFELSAQGEFSITKEKVGHRYKIKNVRGKKGFNVNTYVFAGFGFMFFNPKANLNGQWFALQPLGTEGQGLLLGSKKYSRFGVCIPYGLGAKYNLDKRSSIGLEIGVRKTFTDYIDDVSGDYYDNAAILANNGPIAAALADPSDKSHENWTIMGEQRGDPSDKDSYMFLMVTYTHKLTKRRTKAKF